MKNNQKDVIYIDIDDEITSIIDKLQNASNKIVALVLPKRASMLQSIVNMRLLERSATEAGKSIVLITSEVALQPLAGAVGIYTAKTLQSKPSLPAAPSIDPENVIDSEESDVAIDESKPIGELAGLTDPQPEETIDVTDENPDVSLQPDTSKKKKKIKIPNFNKFRTRLILILGLLVAVIVLWFLGTRVWPKAEITIKTDTSKISTELNVTAIPDAKEVDVKKNIIPAKIDELRQSDTEKASATGQKNEGKKSTGTLTLTNCIDDDNSHTVPAGTQFSKDNKVFLTDEAVTLNPAVFQGGECKSDFFGQSKDVEATASQPGTVYNISSGSYNSAIAGINAFGTDMTGGTDKIIKVLSQKDVDEAVKRIVNRNNPIVTSQLSQSLVAQNMKPLTETLKEGKPTIGASPNVGEETSEATVTVTIVYRMTGIDSQALDVIIKDKVKDQIDSEKQSISNTGIEEGVIRLVEQKSNGQLALNVQTIVTAGPDLVEADIKQEILGKKRGETKNILENRPGVKEVLVEYSPFWVFKSPNDPNKITLIIENIRVDDTGVDE